MYLQPFSGGNLPSGKNPKRHTGRRAKLDGGFVGASAGREEAVGARLAQFLKCVRCGTFRHGQHGGGIRDSGAGGKGAKSSDGAEHQPTRVVGRVDMDMCVCNKGHMRGIMREKGGVGENGAVCVFIVCNASGPYHRCLCGGRRDGSMMTKPTVMIITGYGLNCEAESSHAWELAGAVAERIHLHDLLAEPSRLHTAQALMFIGGFSFGDHLGSGHVFATRIRHQLREDLERFIREKKLILGVCNGFQIMVKLGLIPGLEGDYFTQKISLMQNDCGSFQNFWVTLKVEAKSPCVFTRGMDVLPVPIRHGEGKIFTLDHALLAHMESLGCVACRYADPATGLATQKFPHNPNGSLNAIAGLCDPSGRIFGLMPHPEAYLYPENHPQWTRQKTEGALPAHGLGLQIFENAVRHMNGA